MKRAEEHRRLFEQWLAEHRGLILKVVGLYAFTPEDRDDLFQEILLQLWASLQSFRQESKASTWIYRLALNTALTWKRRESKRERLTDPDIVIQKAANPDVTVEKQEELEWLRQEIRQLPESDRSVMLLYLDGVSYQEMAEILGISQSNVGVKLTRIRKRLAEKLRSISDES